MYLSGAQIIIECLKEQNVEIVFGYPGGTVIGVFDALYAKGTGIKHILTAHEQGAAHAADGYARATGKVGVCMATSGPGATNLVTGIANAYMDSVPVIAITVNVAQSSLGKDSFQEVDIAGVTMPVTKHNFIVKSIDKLADTLRRAFSIANSQRKGPVLIDITRDVTLSSIDFERMPLRSEPPVILSRVLADELEAGIKIIKKSKRPLLLVGGGVNSETASQELAEFAEKLDCPVADTLMGKGSFDGRSDRYLGMIGMYGNEGANKCLMECDLLIAIGTRFSDRSINEELLPAILHIDIDAAEINKNISSEYSIVGDAGEVLHELNKRLKDSKRRIQWMKRVNELININSENDRSIENTEELNGAYIISCLYELTQGEAVITTEVGQNQMLAARFYKYIRHNRFITSGGLGTMGFGLPAAIGAQLGRPDMRVINIAGDGCFRMNMNELITVAARKLPIIQIILNNGTLGMVREWQEDGNAEKYDYTTLPDCVDYVKIAEAMGIKAYRVKTKEEFEEVIKKALAADEPMLIDTVIC